MVDRDLLLEAGFDALDHQWRQSDFRNEKEHLLALLDRLFGQL